MRNFKAIVVGIGLTSPRYELTVGSRAAVQRAKWLAQLLETRVILMHSTDSRGRFDFLFQKRIRSCRQLPPEGRATLNALVEEFAELGVRCELLCDNTEPWRAIRDRAASEKADLVLVGKHDHRNPEWCEFGGTPARLLRECSCPVWAVTPERLTEPGFILASTDLTPVGALSTRYAAFLAEKSGAEFHVVHYFQIPMDLQMEMSRAVGSDGKEIFRELRREARRALERELDATCMRNRAQMHIACNSPAQGLPRLVEQLKADLLVMGNASRTGIQRFLRGNTAENIVSRVPCSLLTVKPEYFATPAGAD